MWFSVNTVKVIYWRFHIDSSERIFLFFGFAFEGGLSAINKLPKLSEKPISLTPTQVPPKSFYFNEKGTKEKQKKNCLMILISIHVEL